MLDVTDRDMEISELRGELLEVRRRCDALERRLMRRDRRASHEARKAVDALEKTHERSSAVRAWHFRLRVLRAYYESGGNLLRAARFLRVHRSKIYRHRRASPLFDDCCLYVREWWRMLGAGERLRWSNWWPHRLDEPSVLEGIEEPLDPVSERLVEAGILARDASGGLVSVDRHRGT